MFQVIDAAELARLQAENPTPSLGVMYQLRNTGECYVWGPDSETLDSPGSGAGAAAGVPSAFTSRALLGTSDANTDNGKTLVCTTSQTATVNTGLGSGFGCAFKGAISFTGSATVTDVRTTGAANPWCALVQTGTDTYDAVGGKA